MWGPKIVCGGAIIGEKSVTISDLKYCSTDSSPRDRDVHVSAVAGMLSAVLGVVPVTESSSLTMLIMSVDHPSLS